MNEPKKTCKTPLRETGCLGNPYFNGCLSIQFFNLPLTLPHPYPYPTHTPTPTPTLPLLSQLGHLCLPTPHCAEPVLLTGRHAAPEVTRCFSTPPDVLQDAMPRRGSLTLVPREVEEFPRGDKHFKHVPSPTYLIYLSPIDLYRKVLFKLYDRSNL